MAYACPVCEALVPDGEHLAHHLAVVAMTRGGDHRTWLDEAVPDWTDDTPAELAEETLEHAESVEHDLVDDPRATREGRAGAAPDRPDVGAASVDPDPAADGPGRSPEAAADARAHAPFERGSDVGDVDGETAAILEEARELTRRRREGDASAGDGADAGEERDGEPDANDAHGGETERSDDAGSAGDRSETDSDE